MTSGDINERLERAFLTLIEEKPYSKITVNQIVEKAGVHRNTFYYHYQSIPAMLAHICQRMVDQMFEIYKDVKSPSDCILPLVRYSVQHRAAVLHVYDSEVRQVLLTYVKQIGRFAMERYIDMATEKSGFTQHDREVLTRFFTAGIVGVWTEWVDGGIENDASGDFIRIGTIMTNIMKEAILRLD